MTLGHRIQQKRKEKGLSQEKLGEQLNVSRQTVYKWENDPTIPELFNEECAKESWMSEQGG